MHPANLVKQQAKSTRGSWQTPERSRDLPAKTIKKDLQHLLKDVEYSKTP